MQNIQEGRKHIVLGILAHVDAGKTTLSESLLYLSGAIRRQGRVDHGDAYLDTDSMEKKRGITIFSKQAEMTLPAGLDITLLDTPGHADFSPEMERTLSVLDYAVLVISAPDGVTGQVRTLWRLLCHYRVPAFMFVNKMDQPGMDRERLMREMHSVLGDFCIALPDTDPENFDEATQESLSVLDEKLLEGYLEEGRKVTAADTSRLILERKLFPVYFGSALKNEGVSALADALVRFCREPVWPETFCAKVFKISRDPSGARLSWLRVLGGVLRARMELGEQKVDQIRRYSGTSSETLREAYPGRIVCALGLTCPAGQVLTEPGVSPEDIRRQLLLRQNRFSDHTAAGETAGRPGDGSTDEGSTGDGSTGDGSTDEGSTDEGSTDEGSAGDGSADEGSADEGSAGDGKGTPQGDNSVLSRAFGKESLILPVFRSTILPEEGTDLTALLRNLSMLEEEEPLLKIRFDSRTREISADIMGEVETEIVRDMCMQRFGMHISFGPPSIVYKETIAGSAEGVGHYEPLRHYAEVHVLLEPGEPGSGLVYDSRVSTDDLALNWQRLALSSLMAEQIRGVLTGSEITDMKITLTGGRAHEKHTEGGDFRQASVRALRMGLMSAESVLLEPWYSFEAEIPQENIGRLMADIRKMEGTLNPPGGDGKTAVVTGQVPAAEVGDYAAQVRAYSHGTGQITFSLRGYEPCRHPEDVILKMGYDPASDLEQPADSVFCSHGAGVVVPWDQVREHMHVDTGWNPETGSFGKGAGPADENGIYMGDGDDPDGPVRAFSSDWQKQQKAGRKTFRQRQQERAAGEDELRRIFEQTYKGSSWRTPLHSSENESAGDFSGGVWSRDGSLERSMGLAPGRNISGKSGEKGPQNAARKNEREDYLLVDGYNIIFAWEELRELAGVSLDSAAGKLTEILSDFQGTQRGRMIIVFDAYRVRGGKRSIVHQGNVDIIYTKEAETADSYIMELTHTLSKKGNVTVATGDGIVQMIIFSAGARRMSASELRERVQSTRAEIREKYHTR